MIVRALKGNVGPCRAVQFSCLGPPRPDKERQSWELTQDILLIKHPGCPQRYTDPDKRANREYSSETSSQMHLPLMSSRLLFKIAHFGQSPLKLQGDCGVIILLPCFKIQLVIKFEAQVAPTCSTQVRVHVFLPLKFMNHILTNTAMLH